MNTVQLPIQHMDLISLGYINAASFLLHIGTLSIHVVILDNTVVSFFHFCRTLHATFNYAWTNLHSQRHRKEQGGDPANQNCCFSHFHKRQRNCYKISASLCALPARSIQILLWDRIPHLINFSVPFLLFKIVPIGGVLFSSNYEDGYSS